MEGKRKEWVEAAKILSKDTFARVKCPECGIGYLMVQDELLQHWENKIDRYMVCNHCGQYNILTMEVPGDYKSPNDNTGNN